MGVACARSDDVRRRRQRRFALLSRVPARTRGLREPKNLELLVPEKNKPKPSGALIHRTREPFQIYKPDGIIPITTLSRTLIDLAEHLTRDKLESALNAAWREQQNIASWLRHDIAKLKRTKPRGLDTLLGLVNAMGKRGLDSELEVEVSRILSASGLPPPTKGLIILDDKGHHLIRGDFGWEEFKTVLHCDSVRWHGTEKAMVRDAAQRSQLSLMNWIQIIVMKRTLRDPRWVAQLRRAITGS